MALSKVTGPGIVTTTNLRVGILTADSITVGSTITYEDVTEINSVGVITAQGGVHIGVGGTIFHAINGIHNGKVGIGTTNPTSQLQVYRRTVNASNPIIQARSNHGSSNALKFEIDGDGDTFVSGALDVNGRGTFDGGVSIGSTLNVAGVATFSGKIESRGDSGEAEIDFIRTNAAGTNENTFGKIAWLDSNNNDVASLRAVRQSAVDDAAVIISTRPTGGSIGEKLRINTAGDALFGNHGSRIFDDTSGTNVVVDVFGGSTAGKRGILSLSGRTGDDNADIGTIWFSNENNTQAGTASHNASKLVASIDVKSETTDSNAGSDSGGHMLFSTKAEAGQITERLRITGVGSFGINNDDPLYPMHFKNAMGSSPSWIHMEVTGSNTTGGGGGIAFDTSASNATSNNSLFLATISGERSASANGSNTLVFKTSKASVNGDGAIESGPKTQMVITEDGNVGIGTAAPDSDIHLHVWSVTTGDTITAETQNTNSRAQIVARGKLNTTGAPLELVMSAMPGEGGFLFTRTNHPLCFSTNNASPQMELSTAGNLGIGEASADNKLHIRVNDGTAYSTNTNNTQNLTNAVLKLENSNGSDGSGVNNYVGIQFSVANGATSSSQLNYVRTGDNAGAFRFKARNASSTFPNLMSIHSTGDVGIGTDAPVAPRFSGSVAGCLHLRGTKPSFYVSESDSHDPDGKERAIFAGLSGGSAFIGSNGDDGLQFLTGNGATGAAVQITNDGTVNMGSGNHTTNKVGGQETSGQDVDGTLKIYDQTTNRWLIQGRSDHSTNPNGIFIRSGNSNSTYSLYTCGTDESKRHLVVNGKGAVGIGTDENEQKDNPSLHIHNPSSNDDCRISFSTPTKSNTRIGYFGLSDRFGIDVVNGLQVRDAADSFATRMTILSDGKFGVGTSSPAETFHVKGLVSRFQRTDVNGSTFERVVGFVDGSNTERGSIRINNANIQIVGEASDYRLKENIISATDGITRIKTLKLYKFNYIETPSITHEGFLAHEVEGIVPQAVSGTKDQVVVQADVDSGEYPESKLGDPIYQGLDLSKFVPILTLALKEAIAKIEILETKVATLESS